ncbi:probable serine hydrolase [Diorhabda carinulata]|uniref:probable serine hydrolase n=1 Tax=Diorhabda carinulata TaxID=1163345 RepID=UPI00259FF727|nr:probable serine hydrolase [Diorhabda carinulata]
MKDINNNDYYKANLNDFKEIKVPVPWGYICGKWWGSTNVQPIIGIHGWQDNSGTFDTVAPYIIERGHSFFCIDLPGHGFSSHIPKGLVYNLSYDGVYYVRRIVKYFDWKKIILIGHSLGGGISFLYASTYPNDVIKFISIDNCGPCLRSTQPMLAIAKNNIDNLFEYEKKDFDDILCYEYDEMLDIMIDGHHGSVYEEGCKILLKRGMKPSTHKDNCYVFTRDPRLKINAFAFFTLEKVLHLASRITCEVLNIRAKGGNQTDPKENYDIIMSAIEKSAKRFERVLIEGTHHVHLNDADVVGPIIVNFLSDAY